MGEKSLEVFPYLGHLLALQLTGEALQRIQAHDPQALQSHYLAALELLLEALANRAPLGIILEDVHWADPSSTELLLKLLPLTSRLPILFCFASRPDPE